jgi:prolyl oligopeptidase
MTLPDTDTAVDPFLWLEEIDGERALDFVRAGNARTLAELESRGSFVPIRDAVREVLDSQDRIPQVEKLGEHLYNFWQDRANPRGLWRRTTWEQFRAPETSWEIVLDLDALAREESENWVWKSAQCLPPAYERCLVTLSRGGGDAAVVREFDLRSREFVRGGFNLPEAKAAIEWRDLDTVYVATDFGPGSLTESGYARIVKRWQRGTPLLEAVIVFEGQQSDVLASPRVDHDPRSFRETFVRLIAFYRSATWLMLGGSMVRLDLPEDAEPALVGRWLVVRLRSPYSTGQGNFPAGALIAAEASGFLAGDRNFEALFVPYPRTALQGWTATRNTLVLDILDNVSSRPVRLTHGPEGWAREDILLPGLGSATIAAVDRLQSDEVWITYQDFLTPPTLMLSVPGRPLDTVRSMPALFDASGMTVEQLEATSTDGTSVPYFVIRPRDRVDGPTLLYGYGGFEISLQPVYNGASGRAWLVRGGTLVIANIRGGGEFGPAWHQAALKANRQRAYDDFMAVANDLIRRGMASPQRLGIMGGSNGGLLVGAVLMQRPDLFGAVVCQVPLLDMRRYNKLLAGASWMAEYGDPDRPEDWDYISRYSPYHNLRDDRCYPPTLFVTSTRDDRVHPGHARKMYARMSSHGHDVWYYENLEGGHAAAADNEQRARMNAVQYTFLWKALDRR